MLIPIDFSSEIVSDYPKLPPTLAKISHDEVVLIELQGSLEIEGSQAEKEGELVGVLEVDEALKKPTLTIGHHLLEGKIATLPKPIAVIHRSRKSKPSKSSFGNHHSSPHMDDEDDGMGLDKGPGPPMDNDQDGGDLDKNGDGDGDSHSEFQGRNSSETQVSWDAIAIIKRKIIFSKRPMPIRTRK